MPPGTPYHSFALPYPIRVDNFTDTIDDLPPPYNRPRLHLLTHTHSDHIVGLASKSFAYRVICSPDAKEMLLRHELYAERSLHDHEYRAEKTKTFKHLKVNPYVMPNGQQFFTGSRDLLHAIPLNTPTVFEISDGETVTITLVDANHCPGSVMFLIEGPRGTVLHTGDLRAEPWFLSSIQRNHFLQPYLAGSSEDLRIFVARREGIHPEATGLVKTIEAIYLDTACLLSPASVPTKKHAVQGIVGLIALFPSTTYFFINTWTWGYEDVLKGIAHAFRCKIHMDRYKHSIYSHGSDPFLRALGTRDAASTRFHACERFDRCSFVDVPPYDYGAKGAVAPPSKEGKKVVYVNAVNMSCSHWEEYQANIRRRVLRGENVDSLLVPLSRHSPLLELMNFVALFRPLRVVPNTLDPSLNGLDWGAMSNMFSGCLAPASSSDCLVSVMAPPCPLTCHPSVASLPGPSTKYDPRLLCVLSEEESVDTAIANLIGPGDAAEQWGDKGGKKVKFEVLRTWLGTGRRKGFECTRRRADVVEDAVPGMNTDQLELVAGSSRLGVSPRTSKRYARSDYSDDSSDEGGSDDHARTAWKLFGAGELTDACKTWVSPSPQSQSPVRVEVNMTSLPTPTSSPLLRKRDIGEEHAIEHVLQSHVPLATSTKAPSGPLPTENVMSVITPDPSRLMSLASTCTSPFVSFRDSRISGHSLKQKTDGAVGLDSQPLACLDNVALPNPSEDLVSSTHLMHQLSQGQYTPPRQDRRNQSITDLNPKRELENTGDASPSKRQRIEKGDEPGLAGGKPPAGRNRTQAERSVTSTDDRKASLPLTSALQAEGVLGSAPRRFPALAAAPVITFPVRRRIESGANQTGKTASLSALSSPRMGTSHGHGLERAVDAPVLTVERVSTVVRAKTVSIKTSSVACDASARARDVPVSPRTAARRAERAERRRITEKLRLARPDLIRTEVPRVGGAGCRLDRAATASVVVASMPTTILTLASTPGMDVEGREAGAGAGDGMGATEEDTKVDWEKSHRLAERVREALKRGDSASDVLPRLGCLKRWYADRT